LEEFGACWEGLEDPRTGNATLHHLHDLLMIALCSVICGGENAMDMAAFAKAKEPLLRGFLRLPNGVPSHDTFSRLFRLLDPAPFGAGHASGKSALHMVSAWGCEQRMVLGQIATDAKSNEITAVPKLLAMLSLKGTIITADGLNCQRAIAQQIVDQGGDYALALKGNQATLHDDVRLFLDDPTRAGGVTAQTVDGDHGRIETRTASVSTDIGWLQENHDWPGLRAIGKVERMRETHGKTTRETAYYLLSTALSGERFLDVIRAHWGVENRLHWRLDVVMNEDQQRARLDNGPNNLAVLRHIALNVIQKEGSKGSLRGKLKRAAWDENYLRTLLALF